MLIIAMQVSTHFHSRQRDGSNNRRPFYENPHKPVFHLMITAFVITASAFPGMDKTLSRRVTYGSPVCNVVLHVHVSLLHMYMSYCPTCTCRTALHVHLKQCYTPRLHTFLYETLCENLRSPVFQCTIACRTSPAGKAL